MAYKFVLKIRHLFLVFIKISEKYTKSYLIFFKIIIIILSCKIEHVAMATKSMLRHTMVGAELRFRRNLFFFCV